MKKALFLAASVLLLAGCQMAAEDGALPKDAQESLKQEGSSFEGSIKIENILDEYINIALPEPIPIEGIGYYNLDCRTLYYTAMAVSGGEDSLIPQSYVKVSEGNEKEVLYIEGETAKFFGGNYSVLQDDTGFLVMVRSFAGSGLTEVVTINKESGLGFDTKTKGFDISGQPATDTYILVCREF